MELVKQTATRAELNISINELNALLRAIKETCKYIGDFGFNARIGYSSDRVMSLVDSLFHKVYGSAHYPRFIVAFSFDDLIILNNVLNEVCHGFRLENFESKIGLSREKIKDISDFVYNLVKTIKLYRSNDDFQEMIQREVYLDKTQLLKEKVCLKTQGYQVSFYLKMSSRYVNLLDLIVVIDASAELGQLRFQTPLKMTTYQKLLNLAQYLEQHLEILQKNPGHISPPFLKSMGLFKIQALAMNWTAQDEETFTLLFMLTAFNIKKEDNIGTYAGAESRITFQNARDFISSMRAAIAKFSQNPET